MPMPDEQFHYRVILTEGQKAELMNLLKEGWRSKQVDNRRAHERVEYWLREVGLEIDHPGGGVGLFLVYPREVSAGGISVIHGAFVHPHSRCKVQLTTIHGNKQLVTGRVAWCDHLRGPLHGLGIQPSTSSSSWSEKTGPTPWSPRR